MSFSPLTTSGFTAGNNFTGLIGGGVGLYAHQAFAPFAIAGACTLQLAAGIFGAWDVTLWVVSNRKA